MSITYTVKYHVTGTDHNGYCSGADANDDDFVDYTTTKTREKKERVTSLKQLNFCHSGCNSGGSGYCCGFSQVYIALKVIDAKESKPEKYWWDPKSDDESTSDDDDNPKSDDDDSWPPRDDDDPASKKESIEDHIKYLNGE